MDHLSAPRLRDRLLAAADIWAAACGRSTGALSSIVANHGQALDRLRDPANKVTDATLEKFAAYLADPANWPEGAVPQEAIDLAHVTGVTPASPGLSPGKIGGDSRADDQRSAA